jgi:hypothetical protein
LQIKDKAAPASSIALTGKENSLVYVMQHTVAFFHQAHAKKITEAFSGNKAMRN